MYSSVLANLKSLFKSFLLHLCQAIQTFTDFSFGKEFEIFLSSYREDIIAVTNCY